MTEGGGLARALMGAAVAVVAFVLLPEGRSAEADTPVLNLRAAVVGADAAGEVTVTLLRWSADAERAPLLEAFAAPPPAPPEADGPAAGRGGRGGARGRGAAPPADPLTRLEAAVRAAPTIGFIWAGGPTGYSVKYAWRAPASPPEVRDRIVLVTDRRIGAHLPPWPQASGPAAEADFTVIELRVDAGGSGEGKASLMADVVIDAAASTLAIDGYDAAPVLFEVRP
jgi:hypothetical protein